MKTTSVGNHFSEYQRNNHGYHCDNCIDRLQHNDGFHKVNGIERRTQQHADLERRF